MKSFRKVLYAAFAACALIFASCSDGSDDGNENNEKPAATVVQVVEIDRKTVTLNSDGTVTITDESGNTTKGSYTSGDGKIVIKADDGSSITAGSTSDGKVDTSSTVTVKDKDGTESTSKVAEVENVSLEGTYWTRVKDNKEGNEYLYFTSDTEAAAYEYYKEKDVKNGKSDKTGYVLIGKWTFNVNANVLTALKYWGRDYKNGEWHDDTMDCGRDYAAAMTVYSSSAVFVLTSPDGTKAENYKKVDSAPAGETTIDKSSSSDSDSSSGSYSSGSSSSGTEAGGSSSGSESDDDWKKILPSSQGENPLSGHLYSCRKEDGSKVTVYSFEFTEDTAVESKEETEKGKSELSAREYKYTYNADKGLLYLKLVSWTVDGEKITSSEEFFEFCAKEFGMTVEKAKELMADYNDFEGYETRNCFKKDESTVIFGDYFDGKIVDSELNCYISGSRIKLKDGITVDDKTNDKKYEYEDGEFASDKKTFIFSNDENVQVSGSWSDVVKASKTLKEQYEETNSYSDKKTENNGYIIVKFSKLTSEMQASPFNMNTYSPYKFFFDPNVKEFSKIK